MKKINHLQRLLSLFLCLVLVLSCVPLSALAATPVARNAITQTVTDPGTADTWEHMMGTTIDGNRYAGRVWADKSVYKDGDIAVLNSKNTAGSSFQVALEDDEAFQIVFSVLGSTMSLKSTVSSTGPMDVVLALDTSTSMDDEDRNGVTRLERTIDAANKLLDDLLTLNNVRIAIVTYNRDSETVLPLAAYDNGIDLVVTNYYNNNRPNAGVVFAYDDDGTLLGKDSGYTMGTNLQAGIDRSLNILANEQNTTGRIPVAIVLTDGQANRAAEDRFYELSSLSDTDGTSASNRNLYLSTLLNAAYNKTKVEANYGRKASVYTVGVDVSDNAVAQLLMNPSDTTNGFHDYGNAWDNYEITQAYRNFQSWASGRTVTHDGWRFDHGYPTQNGTITDAKIAANIYYADTYYDVNSATLGDSFDQIYEELASGVFNPITSTTIAEGGTGVQNTPLIYVDFIGQHMEIKKIQSVSLFGASYGVLQNADGTYTVTTGTGTNPTTNERWNTAEDIKITVTEQTDGTQKLEIRIEQEILPIILEQVVSETVGKQTTATITELVQNPLRVYYTVGVDSDILLPNGEIDVSKIQGYSHINADGTVSFYSNGFGGMNPADNSGTLLKGDAHVGFLPSPENRYYYHQTNQGIFTGIKDKTTGNPVTISENNEYGIIWDDSKYDLNWMTYEEYLAATDSSRVYTYVTYYHPTPSTSDAATAAEEITYLVYTNWEYLKESVAFYDDTTETYLNGGKALDTDQAKATVDAYIQANPGAKVYAVLGIGSHRTSRLHNMTVNKTANLTQTATERYAPEYTYALANKHNDNDVVVWLGNNGKQTVQIDTGIALTKAVTKAIGDPDDTYTLTVTVPAGVVADPQVQDSQGNTVSSRYAGNVLSIDMKAGQTVYIHGIPAGTECAIGEVAGNGYYVADKTDSVIIPTLDRVLAGAEQFVSATVTNAPYEYGSLFITKEITSDHTVPDTILDTPFEITVDLGSNLANRPFQVSDNTQPAPYSKTTDANGNMVFQIKARQTIEILGLPAGTAATVTETAPGSHFAVTYRTRNHSGQPADQDNAVTIPQSANATAVVLNHYTPAPVSVDLDIAGTKNFTAEGSHPGGTFVYQVQQWNGQAWENITGKSAETPYAADTSGTKTFTIENVLEGIQFTRVGNFAYQVVEVKGDVANVTYDRTLYTFDVTVTDNAGQLVATVTDRNNAAITDGSYEVTFNNTYHTAPVSVDITKIVDNLSGDASVSKAGFAFTAIRTDSAWNPLTGNDAAASTVHSDAAGKARFTATYTTAGQYYYELVEAVKAAPGWNSSAAAYRITVNVTEQNGELDAALAIEKVNSQNDREVASVDANDLTSGSVSFVNTYDPTDVSLDLDATVKKVLTGKALEDNMFTFYVYLDGDRSTPVLTGTNKANGDVHFVDFDQPLTISSAGTYRLDVVESIPVGAAYDAATDRYVLDGMSFDPTIYDLVVDVTNDPATGTLKANYYFEDAVSNQVTFYNSYEVAPTEYTLGGTKVLHGRSPRNGEFTFELYDSQGLVETVSNKADGSFSFSPIPYTKAGTYTYTVKEVEGRVPGVRYTGVNHPVTVTVTVTDNQGKLSAVANISNANILFENSYAPSPATVVFSGTKSLKGGTLNDGDFTFHLYATDSTFDIAGPNAQLVASRDNANGAFSFTEVFSEPTIRYYTIVEDVSSPAENVVYDRTEYNVMVQIRDTGDGQLKAVVTNLTTGTVSAEAPSVATAVSFTNATFDEVTEKEVYLSGQTTQIDGKKVTAGDVLTYFITYTNHTGENVVVDIMDTLPAHTTYVEGSASHGGTYAGTHVNWVLNVAKGESVTVSFDAKVDKTDVVVANTAVVRDGFNTYHTNEVVNHTVEEELVKEVFSAADASVSIDGKQVSAGDELVYKLRFTNASRQAADITITDVIPAHTTYVAGSADNGGVLKDGAIVWQLQDVPAWQSVEVSFKVTVNANTGAVTIKNQGSATDGTNTFSSNEVTTFTVGDEVEKTVFNASAPTVSVDGKSVHAGDTLVYAIRYKNAGKEKVSVTITDTVPAGTAYVPVSADNGGWFENGVITWKLDVEPGKEVTVTFKVTVKSVAAIIKNTATVQAGKNTYSTNQVTTDATAAPPATTPQTGDTMMLHMWFAALFVGTGGLITTAILGKKKNETENA